MAATYRQKLIRILVLLETDELWQENAQEPPKRQHRCWVRRWIARRENEDPNTLFYLQKELELEDHSEFISMLRMDVDTFYWLLEKISPAISRRDTNYRKAIPAEQRLSLTLTYLSQGGTNAPLSRDYRMGRSTVGKIIKDTCQAIYNVLKDDFLTTSTDQRDWKRMAKEYEIRWNFAHCIGAIDGKHIKVKQPNKSGSIFYNYKGTFSIVLLAIVTANYEFAFVDVGSEGRVADGGIWRNCSFKIAMDSGEIQVPAPENLPEGEVPVPYVLVGDDAFPLGPGLLKRFSHRDLTYPQQIFNYRLCRARRLSENAFGIIANRFRIFLSAIERPPETVEAMVLAACTLHNVLRRRCPRIYLPPGSIDREDANYNVVPGEWRTGQQLFKLGATTFRNPTNYAKAVRNVFAEHFAGIGRVP